MPVFEDAFSVLKSDRKLTKEELVRAIRFMIAAEYEAVQLYNQLAESIDDEMSITILNDIADEEKVHAGEFLKLLYKLDPQEEEFYEEGMQEVEEMKFSSVNEAIQHLSDITGQNIRIATSKYADGWIDVRGGAVGGFSYTKGAPDEWAKKQGAIHTIHLNNTINDSGKRGAKIFKTVAYVMVDEDEEGNAVWEKWDLKKNVDYNKENVPEHKRLIVKD